MAVSTIYCLYVITRDRLLILHLASGANYEFNSAEIRECETQSVTLRKIISSLARDTFVRSLVYIKFMSEVRYTWLLLDHICTIER